MDRLQKTMEKNNSQQSNGGMLSGFLLGSVVGAAVALLLTTKKGKKIISALTEEGFGGLSDLESLIAAGKEEFKDLIPETKSSKSGKNGKSSINIPHIKDQIVKEIKQEEEKAVEKIKATGRRFFRGIPKRN